ncbi:TrkA family potassium uptake protein [Malonomonas rubra]|uniref:potassium channel family protein n=1 Tax=Malonomonas rubra TaxID=57040 RepID=UPI0026EC0B38|nr:TrkA family potassium uptake protein [Malonomonas rubra]
MGHFCVIGAGNFGFHLASSLYQEGHDVIVIDSDRNRLQKVQDLSSYAILADAADKEFLAGQGLTEMDAVIISTGEQIHQATLITLYLKELGCKRILVKSNDEDHSKILRKVGASEIIFPEKDMALKTARSLISPNVLDYLPMVDDYSISELAPPKHFLGKNLIQLDLRRKYDILVIGIKDVLSDRFILLPSADHLIKESDLLVIFGKTEDVDRAAKA